MVKLGRELIYLIALSLVIQTASSTLPVQNSTNQTVSPSQEPSESLLHLPLANYYNSQYSGQLLISSTNQSLSLTFDTGSLWIWIPGDKIKNQANTQSKCNSSSICSISGFGDAPKAGFTYISHSETINGYVVQDNLTLNGDSMKVTQSFLLATSSVATQYSDGVCGLSLSNANHPTLLDNLYQKEMIKRKAFGLYLADNPESYGETTSEITFGGANPTYYTGNFTNLTIQAYANYWQIDLEGMSLNNQSIGISAQTAVIASGTNEIIMFSSDFIAFQNVLTSGSNLNCYIGGFNQNLQCDCRNGNISQFPSLSFILANQTFTISASLYLDVQEDVCNVLIQGNLGASSSPVSSNPTSTTSESDSSNEASSTTFSGGINPNTSLGPGRYIILGAVFLRNYYTLFDVDNNMVSFATVVHPSRSLITAVEVIMIIFAIFIIVMFLVFAGRFVRFWRRKIPKVEGSTIPLVERKMTVSQMV